jgi:hypothetical protein
LDITPEPEHAKNAEFNLLSDVKTFCFDEDNPLIASENPVFIVI